MHPVETTEVTYMDTKLAVPYFSQYMSVSSKEQALKACGMTCVYMMLKYFETDVPSLDDMVNKGIEEGGFGKSGWIHDYFVDLFGSMGHPSSRKESMREHDVALFVESLEKGNPVIISAERRLFDTRMFHMVVLTGFRKDSEGNLEGFFYHDPASLQPSEAQHRYVPLSVLYLSWRKMAIFAAKA
jgi:hypothetical protein